MTITTISTHDPLAGFEDDASPLRLITNDRYAPVPCVMSEDDFTAMNEDLGWDGDFSAAGPVVTTKADVLAEVGGTRYEAECIEQFESYR